MHNPFIANDNLDEIVFANRNKSYGAYMLRKEYDSKITTSLGIVFGGMIVLFSAGTLLSPLSKTLPPPVTDVKEEVKFIEIDIEQLMKKPAVLQTVNHPVASQPVRTQQNTSNNNNYLITNETPVDPPETQPVDPIGATNTQAAVTGIVNGAVGAEAGGIAAGLPGAEIGSAENPYVVTDVMPQFADGNLYEYLKKKMSYPERALAANKEGKVIVVFDVMPDGSIANVKIKKGIGFGCDEEALRVVSQMPAWKPGIMKGKAVLVRLHLPIQFVRE